MTREDLIDKLCVEIVDRMNTQDLIDHVYMDIYEYYIEKADDVELEEARVRYEIAEEINE